MSYFVGYNTLEEDVVPLDNVELDLSEVFGALPVQASHKLSHRNYGNSVPMAVVFELIYDDTEFIPMPITFPYEPS